MKLVALALLLAACETRVNPPSDKDDTAADGDADTDADADADSDADADTDTETGIVDTSDPVDTDTADTAVDTDTAAPDTSDPGDTDTGAPDTSDPGDTDTAGTLVPVDYCHLQYPCEMTATGGLSAPNVYGWVYQAGVTEGPGVGVGITLQLGYGAVGTDPAGSSWVWGPMTYNLDKDGLVPGDLANDEWMGSFIAPVVGTYDYAVRASADGGASWTYCDGGGDSCGGSGSSDGYSPADAGQLTCY